MAILPGAEPFLLPGGDRGLLLIHGFTGSPAEMRPAGEFFRRRGYTVLAPRLAGHGTSPADLARTGWPQWHADAVSGYHLLKGLCPVIDVVGLSMGGLLALKLAAEQPVGKIALINTPIYVHDRRLPFLPVFRLFRSYEDKRGQASTNVSYRVIPLKSLASLVALIKQVEGLLPDIARPALVIQAVNDPTVRPDSADHIYRRLGGEAKRLVWLERSGHVATLDSEHQQVFQYIDEFFAAQALPEGDKK